jgi:hypothetical protein
LRKLDFGGSDLRDQDLADLKTLPIMFLDLSETKIGDASIPHFLAMPELFSLKLEGTKVTPEAVAKLKKDRPKVSVRP